MESKKLKISIGIVCLAIFIGLVALVIQSIAVDRNVNYQIKIIELRTDSKLGYGILRTNAQVNKCLKIWNLVKMNENTPEEMSLYCVQAELGFVSDTGNNNGKDTVKKYDKAFDMKLEADKKVLNDEFGKENDKLIIAKSSNDEKYSRTLWLADNMYVPGKDTVEDKISILKKSGVIDESKLTDYTTDVKRQIINGLKEKESSHNVIDIDKDVDKLSDEEIDEVFYSQCFISDDAMEVVQQLAFWYFIHDGDETKKANYHHDTLPALYCTPNENDSAGTDATEKYKTLKSEYTSTIACGQGSSAINFKVGEVFQENAEKYYKWLIENAKEQKGTSYYDKVKYQDASTIEKIPIKINDEKVKIEDSEEGYIVGPYEIERVAVGFCTVNADVSVENYKVLDSDKKAISNIKSVLKDEIGKYQFYLEIPSTEKLSALTVKFKASSNNRLVTLLLGNDAQSEQPILLVENKQATYQKEVTVNNKKFDLALRKTITGLKDKNNNEKNIVNTQKEENRREIVIQTNDLNKRVDGKLVTTATYKHRKDPVLVEPGDLVTYTLTIFNEGDTEGRATKVVDVLPEGLEFVKIVSGDYELEGTLGEGRIILKKKSENNLKPFDGKELDSEKIEIQCKVTANSSVGEKILTNIALILEEYNAETQTLITNEEKLDRDSEPYTYPIEAQTREMSGYKGNASNKEDLSDSDYFYKGEQDDDDFEKLILKSANFDLSLRKYITKVETKNDEGNTIKKEYDREPRVDVSKLNGLIGEQITTTADYNHTKTPVPVKIGDIVTYTIRVYNEGDIDGYVAEITDYLPKWLEFLPNDELNQKYLWSYTEEGGTRIVKTEITSKDNATGKLLYGDEKNIEFRKDREEGKLLKAYNPETMETLDYIDVQIRCKVVGTMIEEKSEDDKVEAKKEETEQNGEDKEETITENKEDKAKQDEENKKNETEQTADDKQDETKQDEENEKNETEQTADDKQDETKQDDEDQKDKTDKTADDKQDETKQDEENKKNENEQTTEDKKEETKQDDAEKLKPGEKITNIAVITKMTDSNGSEIEKDRDSIKDYDNLPSDEELPGYKDDEINSGKPYIPGQEDDDDFEKVIIQVFDLSLRKFITEVDDGKNAVSYEDSRAPQISKGTAGRDLNYSHPKNPIGVQNGNLVTYTIRVYNEGDMDGYAKEVTDSIPEGLQFYSANVDGEDYRWTMYKEVADGSTFDFEYEGKKYVQTTNKEEASLIKTDYLSKAQETASGRDNLLKAFDSNDFNKNGAIDKEEKRNPDYRDLQVIFKVTEPNTSTRILTNIAEITDDEDKDGHEVEDEDSTPGNGGYDFENNDNNEDDIDFDRVKLLYFDLALRKFITEVEGTPVNNRYPVVKEGTDGRDFNYEHTKEPIDVISGNTVIYTIRVYNEGSNPGYASEVMDDLPEGIVFLPEHATNVEYRWIMYKETTRGEADYEYAGKKYVKTDNANEADIIVTDYLDKEISEAQGRDSLLKAYDKEKGITDGNPDYRDIKVAFKVTETNTSDRIIINTAEISRDEDEDGNEVTDKDSTPGNGEEKEDDIDKEYLKLKYFDLALLKWVSQVSVTQDGKTTVTDTGHTVETARDEDPVLVTIDSKKLDSVVVKFIYDIRVENQGEIEGYATELKDHIPEGLKFVAEDNPDWEQVDENTITTDALKETLLKPGDTASVRVVLTWINGSKNLNLKVNYAEISEDYNEWGVPDIDSTPDNWKDTPGEDDDDDAPVLLTLKTGQIPVYFILGVGVLTVIAGGIYLIKKYVYDRMI